MLGMIGGYTKSERVSKDDGPGAKRPRKNGIRSERYMQNTPLTLEQLSRAWQECKVYQIPAARVLVIDHYSYLVKITAGRLFTNLPSGVERDDLVGAGVVGLIKAVDQFDPTRDVKFETYAIALIRGAILEMLRDEDWVPRSIREKLRALERTMTSLEAQLGRSPSEMEVSDAMSISRQEVGELMFRLGRTNVYSLDDLLVGSDGDDQVHFVELLADEHANVSAETEGREIRKALEAGVDCLPERERLVIALYHYEGLTFREIGKVMMVSESRVYQLHSQAMNRLRTFMKLEVGTLH
jgi:RNA polymerase sigma factor FliA